MQLRYLLWYSRFDVGLYIEERAKSKLPRLARTLAVGQGTAGCKHVETKLQHVVFADGAHTAFGLRHLVEFLCGLQVLSGDIHLLSSQEETEIEADGLHGHLFCFGEEACLSLTIAQWLDAAVPLLMVHTEKGL